MLIHLMYTYAYIMHGYFVALVITSSPMNVTVCSGTNAIISCGFTGVDPLSTRSNWSWRIIKRSNDGGVISNETVRAMDINANSTDGLRFIITINRDVNGSLNADGSYLSVGPVDDTYNNTSYQCIFTINDTIIESDTAGTVTVIGMYVYNIIMYCVLHKRFLKETKIQNLESVYACISLHGLL